MNEEQKLRQAKKTYDMFWNRLNNTKIEESTIKLVRTYVVRDDRMLEEDFYWTDHEISPTAVFTWLKTYNRQAVPRRLWAKEVRLEQRLYDALLEMIETDGSSPIMIREARIVPQ